MIAFMGMGEKLPNICYYNNQDYQLQKPYSEDTARLIDAEVQNLIAQQYERAKALLREKAQGHGRLAAILQEREVIFAEDVENIFGPRPWKGRSEELLNVDEGVELESESGVSNGI